MLVSSGAVPRGRTIRKNACRTAFAMGILGPQRTAGAARAARLFVFHLSGELERIGSAFAVRARKRNYGNGNRSG